MGKQEPTQMVLKAPPAKSTEVTEIPSRSHEHHARVDVWKKFTEDLGEGCVLWFGHPNLVLWGLQRLRSGMWWRMSHQKTEEQMVSFFVGPPVLGWYLHKQLDKGHELRSGVQLGNWAKDLASCLAAVLWISILLNMRSRTRKCKSGKSQSNLDTWGHLLWVTEACAGRREGCAKSRGPQRANPIPPLQSPTFSRNYTHDCKATSLEVYFVLPTLVLVYHHLTMTSWNSPCSDIHIILSEDSLYQNLGSNKIMVIHMYMKGGEAWA